MTLSTSNVARVRGFEPRSSVLETNILPLNYTPIWYWCQELNLSIAVHSRALYH